MATLLIFDGGRLCDGIDRCGCRKIAEGQAVQQDRLERTWPKKCVVLLLVLVAAQLDVVLGMDYVRAGVCVAFLCNEVISILENAGLMGVPLPAALKKRCGAAAKEGEIKL
mgnify:CR=1 FL=1